MQNIILATNNQDKIKELSALLNPIICIPQQSLNISEIEETGLSFVENAIIKARHASKMGKLYNKSENSRENSRLGLGPTNSSEGKIACNKAENSSAKNIYSQQLGFQRDANERGEGVYTQYMTDAERICNKAENSSAKSIPALADDSGLVIPYLNGAPGIYSARFAKINGSHLSNIDYLLHCLANTSLNDRRAYFYCALALVLDERDPTPLIITAKWEGTISLIKKGDQGFGYDPIFYLPDLHLTAAELSLELKNNLSHRAQALKKLRAEMELCPLLYSRGSIS